MHLVHWLLFSMLVLFASKVPAYEKLLVLTENFPPYNFVQDGKIVGIHTELVIAILNDAKLDYEHKVVPWKRGYTIAQSRPDTLLYSTSRVPERESLFQWVGPLHTERAFMFKLKHRKDVRVDSFDDLKQYKIGFIDATVAYQILAASGLTDYNLRPTIDHSHLFRLLYNDRIDLIMRNPDTLKYGLKEYEHYRINDFERVYEMPQKMAYSIAINRYARPDLLQRLHESFDRVMASGLKASLLEKYLSE